jgi:aconitate hydratase
VLPFALDPETFRRRYADVTADQDLWKAIPAPVGEVYDWPPSTYIARPPFFELPSRLPATFAAPALLILGDSVTTDHISPAGSFGEATPAGQWLREQGVSACRLQLLRRPPRPPRGDDARHLRQCAHSQPDAAGRCRRAPSRKAATRCSTASRRRLRRRDEPYVERGTPTIVVAGEEYGTGSSRDWAAKGTRLLGVRAVIARSYERIHRANLVGMGVLPLQFVGDDSATSLGLRGDESFDILGLGPGPAADAEAHAGDRARADGQRFERPLLCRIDTPIEVQYYRSGGILPFVLGELLAIRSPALIVL